MGRSFERPGRVRPTITAKIHILHAPLNLIYTPLGGHHAKGQIRAIILQDADDAWRRRARYFKVLCQRCF